MSEKLLSLIIPTYNMAALLPRCLESLVKASHAEQWLEAIVVNDGSKDDSLLVAQQWQAQYPEVVTVIDKPNGNYGSTINAALPQAQGRYVKVLDSDDWFDTAALDALLQTLLELTSGSQIPDIVHTPFTSIGPGNSREVIRYNTMGREPYEYGRVYPLDEVLAGGYIRFFLMHALAYRTEMLREMDYRQTEGVSYTDTEWSCYPTFVAQSIVFLDLNVYQYNLDRAGQTMDPKVLIRCINQLSVVTDNMLAFYQQHIHQEGLSEVRRRWLKQYYENRMRILYKLYLLDMPRADFKVSDMEAFDQKYWPICQQEQFCFVLWPENKLLRIDYIRYWHRHHKRWPLWFEHLNHLVDVVVKWLYVKIFRR